MANSSIIAFTPNQELNENNSFDGRAENEIVNPAVSYLMSLASKRSRVSMRSVLNRVAEMLGAPPRCEVMPWHTLRRSHVQAIMYTLSERELSPATRNTYLAAIKGVSRESWLSGGMSAEEYQRIRAIRGVKYARLPKGRVISQEQVANMLTSSEGNVSELKIIRDRAILSLMIGSGLRKSEICQLRSRDVDLEGRSIVVSGKGDQQQKGYFHPNTLPYLRDWVEAKDKVTEYFFPPINRHGQLIDKKMTSQGLTHVLNSIVQRSGTEAFAPHDTRKTFATKLFESGADVTQVRDAMRHASITTTMIYKLNEETQETIDNANLL